VKLLACWAPAISIKGRENTGELLPARKTRGGSHSYDLAALTSLADEAAATLCYCRLSSHDQKGDLDRQQKRLEA